MHQNETWIKQGYEARCLALERVAEEIEKVEEEVAKADASQTGVSIVITRLISSSLKFNI